MKSEGCCCPVCKLVNILIVLGAINWGLIGAMGVDLFAKYLGGSPTVARGVYIAIGLAGIMKLASCFIKCPCSKASCEKKG